MDFKSVNPTPTVETILQPLVVYSTVDNGRINVTVPDRVATSLLVAEGETTRWTVEVTDLSWALTGIKVGETAFPTSTSSDNLERGWMEKTYKSTRQCGFGLILTSERATADGEAFEVVTAVGNTTRVSNVKDTVWSYADCLGFCTLEPRVTSDRTGGSSNFTRWRSVGPSLLRVNSVAATAASPLSTPYRMRLRVCRGNNTQYPTLTDNGFIIQTQTTEPYRPYYLYNGTTPVNCTPLLMTLKYVRQVPAGLRESLLNT